MRARPITPALAALLALAACRPEAEPDPFADAREACSDHNELRNVYFGDLHVHTSYSFDAYVNEVRVDPFAAYDFARGAAVDIPDDQGGVQSLQIDRPLDFAAVTDHGEYLGEVAACVDPSSSAYDSELCVGMREGDVAVMVQWGLLLGSSSPNRPSTICDSADCPSYLDDAWGRTQQAAEEAYDRSAACSFTSFVGYEWSGAKALSNLHRNVIFRNATVPALPSSHFEEPDFWGLWRALKRDCIDGLRGCDVLAIPHNSNWSNGNMFVVEYPEGDQVELAGLRAELEPLIEVFQHKGDSECMNGLSGILGEPDELCDFEKLRTGEFEDCLDGTGSQGMVNGGCVSRVDFVRGILLAGLEEEARLGVNPYKLGLMASTDTHNGTPGAVAEDRFAGHFGSVEGGPQARLTGAAPGGPQNSPGGLIAVWAEENSRNAIFDAMRRRETYGTSGPRMAVRFFGGWDYPEDMCGQADLVEAGYAGGVPMGGDLPEAPAGADAPVFVVSALKDPGTETTPGADLERAQIIKGWIDAEGEQHIEVFDVAGEVGDASVDTQTCERSGSGSSSLCAVWRDPDFDPSERAWYYARVVEVPSCRWSTRDCNALEAAGEELPTACETAPELIQERAWTSPVWF
ncbi:DUF3604 domain-containing protein [Pseudenhygromyxa sp. WMMC2535]|uniref:DUF3604 domain-containing protein n=1 Tax=Pseudenhygromyxa sp. WMMC2535 TaxID=2712867 RepID=UPI001557EA7B|nr:DUF3604 domain-containing protein [Pseudenhygromyxa sp. WMMC2535]NVB41028.1 DUF3604 domain-containing protein [Pseudenhygromyxa sp. WMMC2535]